MHKYSPADSALEAELQRYLAEEAAEAKAAFHLRMRGHGVRDLSVLRAFELVSRQTFVPHRYFDLAARNLALPIGCGQTLEEPWVVARMIQALSVEPSHRVLQIGAGSGYATAILAQLAAEIVAIERYQSLATAAQARLTQLDITNAAVVWADGLDVPPEVAPFDRILVHGLLTELPESLMDRMTEDGLLVCAWPNGTGQKMTRFKKTATHITETVICPCRSQPILPGVAASL